MISKGNFLTGKARAAGLPVKLAMITKIKSFLPFGKKYYSDRKFISMNKFGSQTWSCRQHGRICRQNGEK
jgi:hypothetical protein